MLREGGIPAGAEFIYDPTFLELLLSNSSGIVTRLRDPRYLGLVIDGNEPYATHVRPGHMEIFPSEELTGPRRPSLTEVDLSGASPYEQEILIPQLFDFLTGGYPLEDGHAVYSGTTPFYMTRTLKAERNEPDPAEPITRIAFSGLQVTHPADDNSEEMCEVALIGPPQPDQFLIDYFDKFGFDSPSFATIDSATGEIKRHFRDEVSRAFTYTSAERNCKILKTNNTPQFFDPAEAAIAQIIGKGMWQLPRMREGMPEPAWLMYRTLAGVRSGDVMFAENLMSIKDPELERKMFLGPLAWYHLGKALRTAHLGGPEHAGEQPGRNGWVDLQLHPANWEVIPRVSEFGDTQTRTAPIGIHDFEDTVDFLQLSRRVGLNELNHIRVEDFRNTATQIWENIVKSLRADVSTSYVRNIAICQMLGYSGVSSTDTDEFARAYLEQRKKYDVFLAHSRGDPVKAAEALLATTMVELYGPESLGKEPDAVESAQMIQTLLKGHIFEISASMLTNPDSHALARRVVGYDPLDFHIPVPKRPATEPPIGEVKKKKRHRH